MAQQTAIKPYNTFVKGIITEAGPLTYPEHASLDEENFVLNRDGSRQRRLGMDMEQDYVLHNVTVHSYDAVASFRWKNAANDTQHQFEVVQVGKRLLIFDADPISTSGNLRASLDMSSFLQGDSVMSVANGMGLFIGCDGVGPAFYIEYNPITGAFPVTIIQMEVRDFWGLDDGLQVDQRPATLSVQHHYNLLNQGWTTSLINSYFTSTSSYPANNQQWFLGKDTDEVFQPALLNNQDFGTTPAPKGRFVISPFSRDFTRNAASGLSTPHDEELARCGAVAFAFQRAFYSGVQSRTPLDTPTSPNLTGYVFYSKTLRSALELGKCYSEADPTSEIDSALADTDGGYVIIPDAGRIHKLIPKGNTMMVLAENGIWAIMGDDGGFRATSNQVVKVSDFGALSASTVVDIEDAALYWNRGGIYMLSFDSNSGLPSSVNVTENNIQTLFNNISKAAKTNAVGSFDPVNRRVQWMYNSDVDYDGVNFRNKYDKELVLDLVLTAFTKNSISSISDPSPYLAGYMETPDVLLRKEGVRNRGESVTKYLVIQFINPGANLAAISFAFYRDESFRDWKAIDEVGVSFLSYMITGYEILGDTMRNKSLGYLTAHFKMTEKNAVVDGDGNVVADNPSGCLMQAQWDWSNHPDSGKWSEPFQAYRLLRPYILQAGQPINYGHEVVTTKNRLRGTGKSLSLYVTSDGDKDCYLYGWSIKISGVSSV